MAPWKSSCTTLFCRLKLEKGWGDRWSAPADNNSDVSLRTITAGRAQGSLLKLLRFVCAALPPNASLQAQADVLDFWLFVYSLPRHSWSRYILWGPSAGLRTEVPPQIFGAKKENPLTNLNDFGWSKASHQSLAMSYQSSLVEPVDRVSLVTI